MKYYLLWLALLLVELHPLQAQSPSSDQKRSQAALHLQVSQIGKDCPNATTTMEENSCISVVEQQTKNDFATFYESLHSLLQPSGEAISQLDGSQELWEHYAQKACEAVDSFYHDGTIRFSAVTKCRIQLTRSRMQDLDALYFTVLHL